MRSGGTIVWFSTRLLLAPALADAMPLAGTLPRAVLWLERRLAALPRA